MSEICFKTQQQEKIKWNKFNKILIITESEEYMGVHCISLSVCLKVFIMKKKSRPLHWYVSDGRPSLANTPAFGEAILALNPNVPEQNPGTEAGHFHT